MIVLSLFRGLIDNAPTMRMIAADTAAEFDLDPAMLHRATVRPDITWPRQVAMARMYATGRFSNQRIANFFGLKHHSTVIHARRAYADRVAA